MKPTALRTLLSLTAGTNIGMAYVARAKPDGYTLYTASNTFTTNKALYSSLSFDPATDFTSVGRIGEAPLVIVVPKESPYKTLSELVKYGQQHSGELTFGTAGMGSSGHTASELFLRAGHFKALHVPYKGGSPAITDLLGGRLSFMVINPLEVISHIKAGKLRALAVLNEKGTPAPIITKLNAALNTALGDPDVIKSLHTLGAEPLPGTAADFHSFLVKNTAELTEVIKAANIKVD